MLLQVSLAGNAAPQAPGLITTVAGTGVAGFSGDGGPATSAQLNLGSFPGVTVDGSGNLFIADQWNHRIRKVSAATGIITTVAGTGTPGFGGDGGPATSAQLYNPGGVAVDPSGNLFIADYNNNRIRKVAAGTAIITTVAGSEPPPPPPLPPPPARGCRPPFCPRYFIIRTATGFPGDGGPATSAQLYAPTDLALDAAGDLFIADYFNHRIGKVDAVTGIISTVAGTGGGGTLEGGFSGDGGPATSALLNFPSSVAFDASGNLFIADSFNRRIRKVAAGTGLIETVAGTGTNGFSGDGGPATSAQLYLPDRVVVDAGGNLFIADQVNNRIRKVGGVAVGIRPTIIEPTDGGRLSRGATTPVTFAWSAAAGASQYAFEHTGPGRQFANPNGTGPDPVNGFGGAGGGFVVDGMSVSVTLPASMPPGSYQIRVIGLSPTGQPVGTFSDAVAVIVL